MKAKVKKPTHRCIDCFYCVKDLKNLSIKTKEPILGTCKFQKFKFLLKSNYCEHYKKKSK